MAGRVSIHLEIKFFNPYCMKKIFLAMMATMVACCVLWAATPITKVDKISPTDEVYMDMATTAASKSVADNGKPCGAVVILNGAWKGSGIATEKGTAEQNAIAASRLRSLNNASVYTVCEPTTEVYLEICRLKADAVYFVVPRDKVIEKGIYPASAYDDSLVDSTVVAVPLKCMDYSDAAALVK